jgi:regulator of sirC expression with transglutaminase-like and TPR domain
VARALGKRIELTTDHFVPVTNRQFLTRMLSNLKGSYWRREAWDKVVRIVDHLIVLNPDAGVEWRDRGIAWSNLGDVQHALADWERYLTNFPDASDHAQIRGQLRRVRHKLARLN